MGRITGSYPDDLDLLIEGAVEAGVFGGKSDALREFVREYFDDHENERIAAAVALYERERITLGDAARLADVDRWTMREILRDHDVALRLGLVDEDDAAYEVETASELDYGDDSDDEESPAK
jgi:predicted HTH domain antitoxin